MALYSPEQLRLHEKYMMNFFLEHGICTLLTELGLFTLLPEEY
jgi:hypothetical protein